MPIDYSLYPKNWKTEIRPAILERANHKCEKCKVPNKAIICRGEWNGQDVYQDEDGTIFSAVDGHRIGDAYLGEVWVGTKQTCLRVVLTIAHLDHNTKNNDYSNLKALCQRCHLHLDINLHKANRKASREKKGLLQKLF